MESQLKNISVLWKSCVSYYNWSVRHESHQGLRLHCRHCGSRREEQTPSEVQVRVSDSVFDDIWPHSVKTKRKALNSRNIVSASIVAEPHRSVLSVCTPTQTLQNVLPASG